MIVRAGTASENHHQEGLISSRAGDGSFYLVFHIMHLVVHKLVREHHCRRFRSYYPAADRMLSASRWARLENSFSQLQGFVTSKVRKLFYRILIMINLQHFDTAANRFYLSGDSCFSRTENNMVSDSH